MAGGRGFCSPTRRRDRGGAWRPPRDGGRACPLSDQAARSSAVALAELLARAARLCAAHCSQLADRCARAEEHIIARDPATQSTARRFAHAGGLVAAEADGIDRLATGLARR